MSNSCNDLRKIRAIILHSEGLSPGREDPASLGDNEIVLRQAHNDEQVVGLWLHGRSPHTQKAYGADVVRFFTFVNKQLPFVTLSDLQDFSDRLAEENLEPASQHRTLSAVKSLIGFAHRIGYLKYDVSKVLRVGKLRDK